MSDELPKRVGGLQVVAIDMRCPECQSTEFFALRAARELAAHCLACGRWFQGEVRQPEVSIVVRRGASALRDALVAHVESVAQRQLQGDAPPDAPPPRGLLGGEEL